MMASSRSLLLALLVWSVVVLTTTGAPSATRNRLECEEDGELIHCQFALERTNMRKHLDTCIPIGKESFCVETKLHLIKRATLYGGGGEDENSKGL